MPYVTTACSAYIAYLCGHSELRKKYFWHAWCEGLGGVPVKETLLSPFKMIKKYNDESMKSGFY